MFEKQLSKVREVHPLVHSITNPVTINDVANMIIACGTFAIMEVTPQFLAQQIDAVFTDIRPDAVKIGMVSDSALIDVIAERLRFYKAENIVVDPVMVATSGSALVNYPDSKESRLVTHSYGPGVITR